MTTNEFFEAVNNLQINDLDMFNHVQHITDGFEPQKLQMLCDDFDTYLYRKIQLSEIEIHSNQSLYVSDIHLGKSDKEQINDLKRLEDSSEDFSFDEYYEKHSYPTELFFLQRLRTLLIKLTRKYIINRNQPGKHKEIKHPIDDYIILESNSKESSFSDSLQSPHQTNKFFEFVRNGSLSDLDVYSQIQALTNNFDEAKLNLLCKDFDFYLFMAKEDWLASFSNEEIEERIEELHEQNNKIPTLNDRDFSPTYVDEYFETPEHKKIPQLKERTKEQEEEFKKIRSEWENKKETILDVENLMDPHGIEFYSIHKLRNLLVDLKREHTSALYKFDDEPVRNNHDMQSKNNLSQSRKGISFTVLDRIVYLTNYYQHADKSVIEIILNRNITDFSKLSNQFQNELKKNIVLSESEVSLKRLIKHYLFELNEAFGGNKINNLNQWGNVPNTHNDKFRQYNFKKGTKGEFIEADKFENYCIAKFDLLNLIIEQLQISILKTGLSLENIFKEMKNSYPVKDEFIQHFELFEIVRDEIAQTHEVEPVQYINWLKSDESRKQFIEALKEYNLIKSRETETIIKDHFEPNIEQNIKPEPIEWVETISLLTYTIESLDQLYIKPKNIWSDTAPHFSIDGKTPGNLRQTANRFKQNNSGKPKNFRIIDNIIQNLPE